MACLGREVLFLVDLHRSQTGRAGQRIAAEGAADGTCGGGVHDLVTAGDRRNRHAAGEGLRGGHDIRGGARLGPVFGGEVLAGTAVAALDFVSDEQDAVLVADLAHGLDPLDRGGDEAAFALERLDEQTGDFIGRNALVEHLLQAVHIVGDGLRLGVALRRAIQVRVRSTGDIRRERAHTLGIGLLRGESHGQVGAAVECAGEADDTLPAGVGLGDLDGVLIAFGAGVGEIGLLVLTATRNCLVQTFCQIHVAFMADDVENRVEVLGRLVLHGLDELRTGVADVEHADAADPVKELVAVEVFEHGAFATLDADWIRRRAQSGGDVLVALLEELLGLGARNAFSDNLGHVFSQCHRGISLTMYFATTVAEYCGFRRRLT